jgi:hypothetical protein
VSMSETLEGIQNHARKLARSGKFIDWRSIAFELRFEPDYQEALRWLADIETQDELDQLCAEARRRGRDKSSEAAC